jgi:hypothetical protein
MKSNIKMEKTENTINLEDFRVQGSKVFTGRDRGEYVRQKSNIDVIEKNNSEIVIIIPENIYSINPSFFEEFFSTSIERLGKERFLSKFKFKSLGSYNYEKPLNEAIERVLRIRTAIG